MKVLLDECFAPEVADRLGELLPPEWTCDSVYLVDLDGTYNGTLHDLAKEAGYDVLVTRDYKMRNETRPLMAVLTVPTPFADAQRVMRYAGEIVDALVAIHDANVEPRYYALDPHPDERRATRLRTTMELVRTAHQRRDWEDRSRGR